MKCRIVLLILIGFWLGGMEVLAQEKEEIPSPPLNLRTVMWPQQNLESHPVLRLRLDWVLPTSYRKLSESEASKKGHFEIWRTRGQRDSKKALEEWEKIAGPLPLTQNSYEDRQLELGQVYYYLIRTVFDEGHLDKKLPQPVITPPRGLEPALTGKLERYNRRYLKTLWKLKEHFDKKEPDMWATPSRERYEKLLEQISGRAESIEVFLLQEEIISRKQARKVRDGHAEKKTEDNPNPVNILGVGSPPYPPFGEIKKSKVPQTPVGKVVVKLVWPLSPDDGQGLNTVKEYVIYRSQALDPHEEDLSSISSGDLDFKEIARLPAGQTEYFDKEVEDGSLYRYLIGVSDGQFSTKSRVFFVRNSWTAPATDLKKILAKPLVREVILKEEIKVALPLLNWNKIFVLIAVVLFTAIFFYFIFQSQKGKELYLRRIEGLNAIEEAIGRSTEMGQPVLYVPGIDDIQEIQTVASLVILSHVAEMTAQYETPLIVPCRDSVVMAMAEEVVRESALAVGRPDTYNPDNIRYLSNEQFAYVAGVDGIMLREKPAANLYLGSFFAESLILAETGYASGAIQVAGTANYHQLPFFIVACDFTIIGEEFYAASAYLSGDAKIVGSIKAADYFKLIVIIFVLILAVGSVFSLEFFDVTRALLR